MRGRFFGTVFGVVGVFSSAASADVSVREEPGRITLSWTADGKAHGCAISLDAAKPVIASLSVDSVDVARDVDVTYKLTVGKRLRKPDARYIFFDYPIAGKNGPVAEHMARPGREGAAVRVSEDRMRATVTLPGMTAGPFGGPLVVKVYEGSPLVHLDAALTPSEEDVAYAYEPLVKGPFEGICYVDPRGTFQRDSADLENHPLKVRHRTIVGETASGSVALFPPPHAYLFPRDFSTNFGFVQAGPKTIGLRQDLAGGNKYVPWADAPKGRAQHMSAFLLFAQGKAAEAVERVKRYTNGDRFVPLDGHVTFISHLHPEVAVAEMEGRSSIAGVKEALTGLGVNIFHMAEFHLAGKPFDTGEVRLKELKTMFDLCEKYSDGRFLMLPGEEANAYLPGHWIYLFPKPLYVTMKPTPGRPTVEEVPGYGTVYRPQNEQEFMQLLIDQGGLAWTTHPRIKASERSPDVYKDRAWYQSPMWLGATWKAMPADLSEPRLGARSLDLLDDMNMWPGRPKYMPSEIDTFDLDPTHEFYGHASVNYLRLDRVPPFSDYAPVLDCLRRGDFFTTTGEVLLHSVKRDGSTIAIDASWTLPLSHAIVTAFDGKRLHRREVPLPRGEFGRGRLSVSLPVEADVEWYRVELWDVATNGAYTQPVYTRKP